MKKKKRAVKQLEKSDDSDDSPAEFDASKRTNLSKIEAMLKQAEANDLETEEEGDEDASQNSAKVTKRKLPEAAGTRKKKKSIKPHDTGSEDLPEAVGTRKKNKRMERQETGSETAAEAAGTRKKEKNANRQKTGSSTDALLTQCQRLLEPPGVQKVAAKAAPKQSNRKETPCMFIKAGKACPHANCRYSHDIS